MKIRVWLIAIALLSFGVLVPRSYAVQLPVWPYGNLDWSQVRVTQDYGCRGVEENLVDGFLDDSCVYENQSHTGIDFGVPRDVSGNSLTDDPYLTIKPALAGKVVDYCSYAAEGDSNSSCSHGFGNWVIQSTGNAVCPYAFYAHLRWGSISSTAKSSFVSGNTLTELDSIGIMGRSGTDATHLHFECKTSPTIRSPDGNDDAPLAGGKINYAYTNDHPSNHNYIDPFTLLTTPLRKLLFVSAPEADIRRGPGTKYSVFAKALKYQGLVAFASVYAEDRTWYRIPQPCSSRSSCAGWIAQDGVTVHEVPTNFPYLLRLDGTYNGTIHADTIPITITSDPFKGSGGIGQEYLYLARVPSTKTTCACWYALAKPQYVDSPSAFAWMCGGDNTNGDWTNPPCSMSLLNGPNQTLLNFDGLFPADARVAGVTIYADPLPTLNDPLPPLVYPVDLTPPDLPPPPSEPVPIPPPTLLINVEPTATQTTAHITLEGYTYSLPGLLKVTYGTSSLNQAQYTGPSLSLAALTTAQAIPLDLANLACETRYTVAYTLTTTSGSTSGSTSVLTGTCSPNSLPYDDGTRVDSIDIPQGMIARFADTFTTGALDTTRWPQQGGSLVCTSSTCKASDDSYTFSQSFTIDPAQHITLIRRVRLHGADPIMRFMVGSGGNPGNWGIFYGNGCMQLYRDHAAPESDCRARSEVSTSVSLPDRLWITERMEWDPVAGYVTLYINDVEQASLSTSPLPSYLNEIGVGIQAGGASSGQSQETDYLLVLQSEPLLPAQALASLSPTSTKTILLHDEFTDGYRNPALWSTAVNTEPFTADAVLAMTIQSHQSVGHLCSYPITVTPGHAEISWRSYLIASPGYRTSQYVEIKANGVTYSVAYQRGDYKYDEENCPQNPGDSVGGYLTRNQSCILSTGGRSILFGYPNRMWQDNLLSYDTTTQELVYTVDGAETMRISAPELAIANTLTLSFRSGDMANPNKLEPNGQQIVLDEVMVWE